MSSCIDRISEATVGVATVASDAGAATERISASAQESSATTQQIAASTVELAGLATELDRLAAAQRAGQKGTVPFWPIRFAC